jgi:hypothetical protein
MDYRIGDHIVVEGRVLVVRGFDPMGVRAGRVYLEDEATGELVVDLIARLPKAEPEDKAADTTE